MIPTSWRLLSIRAALELEKNIALEEGHTPKTAQRKANRIVREYLVADFVLYNQALGHRYARKLATIVILTINKHFGKNGRSDLQNKCFTTFNMWIDQELSEESQFEEAPAIGLFKPTLLRISRAITSHIFRNESLVAPRAMRQACVQENLVSK